MRRYGQIIGVKPDQIEAYERIHAADMAKMAGDPKTQEWWTDTEPMQEPVEGREQDEWWATMKEVFHTD